ncbi:BppU family phage baseplate upper protein [Enterococcus sp.]|uniref:BppU family phage baseplate upper protein n=1 Tax=Enterococcus sp. TaxID=35783 RepID=UPI000EC4E9E2|nr:BppU family phage baseplate upper protein [Enterococcus sp.]HCM87924.1 hypothetical protein [Enterococcus sp.]
MELFEEIDVRETKFKAKRILASYRRLSRIAGQDEINLRSPIISDMPRTPSSYTNKSEVISSDGIEVKDAKKGLFQYTFPSEAFGVAGPYERSYFQFTDKNGVVATTGDFEVIVLDNTDLTANEAETIISEYNKLVEELQQLQKKSISDLRQQQEDYVIELAQAFAELKSDVATLESKIKTYETGVSKTATDAQTAINKTKSDAQTAVDTTATNAKNTISTAATNAAKMISDALEEFKAGDFYTKSEADNHFAKTADLTKSKVGLGNVDNYATANQTDAEQGLAGNKFITPMGVKQHVDSRMADYSEISVGQSDDKMISPKTLADTIKFKEVFKEGIALSNVANEGTLVPHGDSVGGSLNHVNNRPYTVNSDGSFTFKRATNLIVTGGMKLVVGDTNPTDYLHVNAYVNNALNEFIALGATAATNGTLRLTWSAMGQRVISVNSGDVLSLKIGLRSGKQAFAVQLTSLKIEEV